MPSPAEAADITLRLTDKLRDEVEKTGLRKVYDEIDLPLVPVLARMEEAGVKLDCEVLAAMSQRLEREINAKAREIYDKSGVEFNINSPKQLGDVLFNKLNLPKPFKYGKGKTISTAVDVLEGLAGEHEVPRMVLDYRQLSKLKSTYVDALPALLNSCTRRLHTTFNMAGSATGRLSSINPEPAEHSDSHRAGPRNSRCLHRRAGTRAAGRRLLADRIAPAGALLRRQAAGRGLPHRRGHSHAHGIAGLRRAAADGQRRTSPPRQGGQLRHRLWAVGRSGCRSSSASTPKKPSSSSMPTSRSTAGCASSSIATLEQARRDQKVTTLFGRVRPIPDIHSKNFNLRGFAERTAVNTPLQGTAADLIKIAMIRIDAELRERKLRSRMLLQVHDELVFEVPEDEVDTMKRLVTERMENVHALKVPLKVEVGVGPNWRDLE